MTPDGDLALAFFRDDRDADLVFSDDGGMVVGWSSDSHEPEAFEVGRGKDVSLAEAMRRIGEFINPER